MGAILSSEVKFNPVTVNKVSKCGEGDNATLSPVKIKGHSIRFDVSFKGVLELFKGNRSGVVTVGVLPVTLCSQSRAEGIWCAHIEILEGDEVIRVRPLQQRLEHHKIFPRH